MTMGDDIISPVLSTDTCDFGWSNEGSFALTAEEMRDETIVPTVTDACTVCADPVSKWSDINGMLNGLKSWRSPTFWSSILASRVVCVDCAPG